MGEAVHCFCLTYVKTAIEFGKVTTKETFIGDSCLTVPHSLRLLDEPNIPVQEEELDIRQDLGTALCSKLKEKMPGLRTTTEDFIKYQWRKHGCFQPLNPREYFERMLQLYEEYSYDNVLERKGLQAPPLDVWVSVRGKVLCREVRDAYGFTPSVVVLFDRDDWVWKGRGYQVWKALYEIRIYLDKHYKPVDCERGEELIGGREEEWIE